MITIVGKEDDKLIHMRCIHNENTNIIDYWLQQFINNKYLRVYIIKNNKIIYDKNDK